MEDERLLGLIPINVKRNIEQLYVQMVSADTPEEHEQRRESMEEYLSKLSLVRVNWK